MSPADSLHPATYMNTTMVLAGGNTPISTVEEVAPTCISPWATIWKAAAGPSNGMNEQRANAQAYDAAARKKLRTLSLKLNRIGGLGGAFL